jgi:hypothetical protein
MHGARAAGARGFPEISVTFLHALRARVARARV